MKSYLVLFVALQLFFFTISSLTSLTESHNKNKNKNLKTKKTKCRKATQNKCKGATQGCRKDSECCSNNCEWGTCRR